MSPSISPCTGSSSGGGGKRRKLGVGGKEKKEKKDKKQKKQKKAKDAEENGGAGQAVVSTAPPTPAPVVAPAVAPAALHALAGGPAAAAALALSAAAAATRQPTLQAAAAERQDEDEEDEDEEDPGADRMRQALKALRQRREQLDDVQAELEAAKAEAERLRGELGEATSSSAAASVQLQGQLSTARAELEGAQRARAAAAAEAEALQGQLAEARASGAEEARALQSARSELAAVRDAKALLSREADSLRAQVAKAAAEAEEARKTRAATAEEAAAVKSQLAKAHGERDEAQRALVEAQRASLEARTAQLDLSTKLEQERKSSEALRTQLDEASVTMDGYDVPPPAPAPKLWALHKPRRVLCQASEREGAETLRSLLRRWHEKELEYLGELHSQGLGEESIHNKHFVVVCGLPYGAEGLVLLTNDGIFADALTSVESRVLSVYDVKIQGDPSVDLLHEWRRGRARAGGMKYGAVYSSIQRRNSQSTWLRLRYVESADRPLDMLLEHAKMKVYHMQRYSFGPYVVTDMPKERCIQLPVHKSLHHLCPAADMRQVLVPAPGGVLRDGRIRPVGLETSAIIPGDLLGSVSAAAAASGGRRASVSESGTDG